MGMSASQVRFLSLQSRKNSIGRQLLTLSNRKMALSRDMNNVALKFTNALNQTTLKWSNDSGSSYNTLTYDLMMRPNDLNTETPYIVTKASSGEVVLNNDTIKDMDGNDVIDPDTGKPLSYVDIAKMISAYSGMDSSGNCQFNNVNNISTTSSNGVTTVTGGGSAIDNAYYIPQGTYDYNFANSLRYTIFEKMGLISEADKKKQLNLLNQLYGSEEAQKTGIYPIGSAWGDYYLACAKLEAYEDFLGVEHSFSDAESFANSKRTSETKSYANDVYDYSTDIQGISTAGRETSNTLITQEAYSNSATSNLAHIDFDAFTYVDTSGNAQTDYHYTTAEDGTVTTNAFVHDYSAYEENDVVYGGYTYNVDVSADGIKYTYKTDDIWANAKYNFQNNGGSLGWGAAQLGTSDELVEVGDSGSSSLSSNDGNIRNNLNALVDSFIAVLPHTNIININSDFMQQAKSLTVNFFIDNAENSYDGRSGMHRGSKKARNKARARAEGKNHIGISRYGGIHSHSKAYVDCGTLFNTFLSYYSQLSAGNSLATSGCSNAAPEIPFNFEDGSNTTLADTFTQQNGKWYVNENFKNGNTYGTSKYLLTTSAPADMAAYQADGGKTYVFDTTTNQMREYTGSADDAYTKYYLVSDETAPIDENEDTLVYKKDAGGNYTGSLWDHDGDSATPDITIYGTVNHNGTIYYFTNPTALNNYITSGSLTGTGVEEYTPRTTTSAGTSEIIIGYNESSSWYGISINSYANDTEYHTKLKNDVTNAWQHILDLQNDIDNLYSSADQKIMDYYDALFLRIAENGWIVDENTSNTKDTSATYLNNKLQNNDYFVTECSEKADTSGYKYTSKMATSVRKIYQVHDENAENQALAEYETEKSAISLKEQKIDTIMEKLETEQESINTMMESVQKIIQENIDKTFKMFA